MDLDAELHLHGEWLQSLGHEGTRLELENIDLRRDLSDRDLSECILYKSVLDGADLRAPRSRTTDGVVTDDDGRHPSGGEIACSVVRQRLAALALALATGCASPTQPAPPPAPKPAPDLVAILRASVAITDRMDAIAKPLIDADVAPRVSEAACPIDLHAAFDPKQRALYVSHKYTMFRDDLAGGHAAYAASIQVRTRFSARDQSWNLGVDLFADTFPTAHAERATGYAYKEPITRERAVEELRTVSDPAWWTWDLLVIFHGGRPDAQGAHLFGHAYVISYRERRAVCGADFDVVTGPSTSYNDERAIDLVIPQLRALR